MNPKFTPSIRPKIIAHRGAKAKENTIAAFERAIALGADGVEFDVRSTQDQVLVVHHDPAVKGHLMREVTWRELQAIAPEIPTLQDTIACCQGHTFMDIELKEPGYEAAIVQQIQSLPLNSFAITSFHLEAIAAIRHLASEITIGFLVEQETREADDLSPELWRDRLQTIGVNFIAPDWQILETEWLRQRVPSELPFWVWTVNQPTAIKTLLANSKVAGIITDQLALALKLRSP
ncbi:MAG: glycerophosphodiester phosphodiesterase [Oscillatoriophycideae cyanobacterium NC_groundwater_1537_Pr4_S-0.65um_50_18]|nr:glycerophosphodiester phosphodiesterase [Oscillatoriophycideae cyanobacterium NC_groundwater_1537_Pr4_S-0.65um_50_18]